MNYTSGKKKKNVNIVHKLYLNLLNPNSRSVVEILIVENCISSWYTISSVFKFTLQNFNITFFFGYKIEILL